jgi:hypothetical protein
VDTSIYAFATDFADEGIEAVLDNVQHRAGLGGVTIAAAYHEGRDVFPHNPVRKVRFLESGAVFFRPDAHRWRDVRLRPPVGEVAGAMPEVLAAAGRRRLAVRAWTVFLHNGALAEAHPDCAPQNAYGDRYVTDLCPANPDVRAYARALAADVAALGVAAICAESLHYHPLEHGYAHERYFVPLGVRSRFLLGLCFCAHCMEAAGGVGVDGEAARRAVHEELDRVFAGSEDAIGDELQRSALADLDGYLAMREHVVSSLVQEVADVARAGGAELEVLDSSGAMKGYATGRPTGGPAPTVAWQLGLDLDAVAGSCDGIEAIGYAADPERVRGDLEAYGDRAVSVVLRPAAPDCDSAENLRAKVALARARGLRRVDFYHYGLMRLDALDRIRAALAP